MAVKLGIDLFLEGADRYKERTFALVTNNACVTSAYVPVRGALLSAGYKVVRLFSPEHGLEALGEDGRPMPDGIDPLTGLPVVSLYGSRLQPEPAQLSGIDTILFDLPNIGCRFYTYLWTLTHVMEACHREGKELLILDRPNLLSGNLETAEGPLLDEQHCASFVGRWYMPIRHSCTLAELAKFWAASRMPELRLTTIQVKGWDRNSFPQDWSYSFVPTSPAIVDAEAALLYPGLGLLEAINLSEGRGTATPFRVAGAPWMDAASIVREFNCLGLSGVMSRAVDFIPCSSKYDHIACLGLMFHVTDPRTFRPVLSALALIKLVHDRHPDHFSWFRYPTAVNPSGEHHLDKLLGIPQSESVFEDSLSHFMDCMPALLDCRSWKSAMEAHLMY